MIAAWLGVVRVEARSAFRAPLLLAAGSAFAVMTIYSTRAYLTGLARPGADAHMAVTGALMVGVVVGVRQVVAAHVERLDRSWLATVPLPVGIRVTAAMFGGAPLFFLAGLATVIIGGGGPAAGVQAALVAAAIAATGALFGRLVSPAFAVLALLAVAAGLVVASRASPTLQSLVPWDGFTELTVSAVAGSSSRATHVLLASAATLAVGGLVVVVSDRSLGRLTLVATLVVAIVAVGGAAVARHDHLTSIPSQAEIERIVAGHGATDCTRWGEVEVCVDPTISVARNPERWATAVADVRRALGAPSGGVKVIQAGWNLSPGTAADHQGPPIPLDQPPGTLLVSVSSDEHVVSVAAGAAALQAVGLPAGPFGPWVGGPPYRYCVASGEPAAVALWAFSRVDSIAASDLEAARQAEPNTPGPEVTGRVGELEIDALATRIAAALATRTDEEVRAIIEPLVTDPSASTELDLVSRLGIDSSRVGEASSPGITCT